MSQNYVLRPLNNPLALHRKTAAVMLTVPTISFRSVFRHFHPNPPLRADAGAGNLPGYLAFCRAVARVLILIERVQLAIVAHSPKSTALRRIVR